MTLVGLTLYHLKQKQNEILFNSATLAIIQVPITLFFTPSHIFSSTKGTCLYAVHDIMYLV